jgi:hypothetical protein
LEHAIPPDLESKIATKLNYPITCPFGHLISGENYSVTTNLTKLREITEGTTFTIDRIPEDDQPLLLYLIDNQILSGSIASLVELAIYRGVIKIRCVSNDVFITQEVAELIFVRDLKSSQ